MTRLVLSVFVLLFVVKKCELLPNFVIFLTDDQDLVMNSLNYMNNTKKLIANEGVTFTNFFVNSPICCPSRSTILTGQYAHNTKVFNNSFHGGCSSLEFQSQHENLTIAAILKSSMNYKNFYAGKYLNQYGSIASGGTGHVPPGYDWWIGLKGNSRYYNYTLSINGNEEFFGDAYLTDKITDYAMDFLSQESISKENFLMILAPPAPHAPFTPAFRHKDRFPEIKALRNAPFNTTPVDKHWLVEMPPDTLPTDVNILDQIYRNRLRTLLSVDEMVGRIIMKLNERGILKRTFVVFTSDNGFHIGQFTQPWDKRQPYESDIRVPFLMRGPKIAAKTLNPYPASVVDIAPTLLDLAGYEMKEADGHSFRNQLFNPPSLYHKFILTEYWGEGNNDSVDPKCPWPHNNDLAECSLGNWCKCQDSRNNTYSCVLDISSTKMFKFCHFVGDFFEAYDLKGDPHEIENIYKKLDVNQIKFYSNTLEKLRNCRRDNCNILK